MNQTEPDKNEPEGEDKPFSEIPVEAHPNEEVAAQPPVVKKKENKLRGFFRTALRWVIGLLIVFFLGVIAMYLVLYRPLEQKVTEITSERDQAQQTVKNLQGQLDSLTPLSAQNKTLQEQLSKSELHVSILSAEANINAAQVALLNSKPADARLVLNKTVITLKTLQGMLPPDQQKVVTDMQNRLNLALSELDNNKFAAQSDLNVLVTSLLQLENTFLAKP
jgi:cytoskeletal protein RodZ